MNRNILTLFRTPIGYHTVLKTNHGRLVYLALSEEAGGYSVGECVYIEVRTAYPVQGRIVIIANGQPFGE